jgi:hypothetical protein
VRGRGVGAGRGERAAAKGILIGTPSIMPMQQVERSRRGSGYERDGLTQRYWWSTVLSVTYSRE